MISGKTQDQNVFPPFTTQNDQNFRYGKMK